jgi:hypothetical protein
LLAKGFAPAESNMLPPCQADFLSLGHVGHEQQGNDTSLQDVMLTV